MTTGSDAAYVTNLATGAKTNITENTKDIIFINPYGNSSYYWLASRGIGCDKVYVLFGPGAVGKGAVGDGEVNSYNGTFSSTGKSCGAWFSLCPVISLRDEIPAKIPTLTFN